jgi:hypothetical protein
VLPKERRCWENAEQDIYSQRIWAYYNISRLLQLNSVLGLGINFHTALAEDAFRGAVDLQRSG